MVSVLGFRECIALCEPPNPRRRENEKILLHWSFGAGSTLPFSQVPDRGVALPFGSIEGEDLVNWTLFLRGEAVFVAWPFSE